MSATEIIEQIKELPAEERAEVARFVVGQDNHQPFDVTPELESWLLEAADSPTTPLTKADFIAIRKRVRKSSNKLSRSSKSSQRR